MTESIDNPPTSKDDTQPQNLPDLRAQLTVGSEKVQLKAIQELSRFGEEGLAVLMDFLLKRWQSSSVNFVDGIAYQTLLKADDPEVVKFLHNNFPVGVVALHSERGLDYKPLQKRLAEQQFQAADQLTRQIMCQLAGSAAAQRQWLYFTEVDSFPITDLQTINRLWLVHSEGQFGFSVQRQIWLSAGKDWEAFWPRIGWKTNNSWTRYPQEFTWNLSAPRGHLPLSNQLRGVRVIVSLLSHPAWSC